MPRLGNWSLQARRLAVDLACTVHVVVFAVNSRTKKGQQIAKKPVKNRTKKRSSAIPNAARRFRWSWCPVRVSACGYPM